MLAMNNTGALQGYATAMQATPNPPAPPAAIENIVSSLAGIEGGIDSLVMRLMAVGNRAFGERPTEATKGQVSPIGAGAIFAIQDRIRSIADLVAKAHDELNRLDGPLV